MPEVAPVTNAVFPSRSIVLFNQMLIPVKDSSLVDAERVWRKLSLNGLYYPLILSQNRGLTSKSRIRTDSLDRTIHVRVSYFIPHRTETPCGNVVLVNKWTLAPGCSCCMCIHAWVDHPEILIPSVQMPSAWGLSGLTNEAMTIHPTVYLICCSLIFND